MIVYLYLAILIVFSIVTGIIVTIVERKGFYPNVDKVSKKENKKKTKKDIPVKKINLADTVTLVKMNPVEVEEEIEILDYEDDSIPVMLSSCTVDLTDVVNNINTGNCV